jgi:hypothetical protein
MRLSAFPTGRALALAGILLFLLLGTFGISLAHDPAAALLPLQITQLSHSVLLTGARPDPYSLGPALIAEASGVKKSMNAGPERVEYCSLEPGGAKTVAGVPDLRTPKVSLQIINSALQI